MSSDKVPIATGFSECKVDAFARISQSARKIDERMDCVATKAERDAADKDIMLKHTAMRRNRQ
jgi:hypothetical protein